MSTSRQVAAAALGTVLVATLVLFSFSDGIGTGSGIASGWVLWVLLVYGLPAAIIGYIIGILRNIAADARAGRRELEALRGEVEALRHELAQQADERPA